MDENIIKNIQDLFSSHELEVNTSTLELLVENNVNLNGWYTTNKNKNRDQLLANGVELHAARILLNEGHRCVRFIKESNKKTPDIESCSHNIKYVTEVKSSYLGDELELKFLKDRIEDSTTQIVEYIAEEAAFKGIIFIGHTRTVEDASEIYEYLQSLRENNDNIIDKDVISAIFIFSYSVGDITPIYFQ